MHSEELIHGDLKGVLPHTLVITTTLNTFSIKANILIDKNGHARLADFGLLTIVSDSTYPTTSSSSPSAGTTRWMSPELLDPDRFGFENSRPTKESDCYALGMVVLEVLSGQTPFSRYSGLVVMRKVIEGEHPGRPQGAEEVWFTDDLWGMLEQCWSPQPKDRPIVEAILGCLERVSTVWQPLPAGVCDEVQSDSDNESLVAVSYPFIILASNLTFSHEEKVTRAFSPDPQLFVVPSAAGLLERQPSGMIAVESMDISGMSPPRAVSPESSANLPLVMHGKNKRAHIDDPGSASGFRPKNKRRTSAADANEIPTELEAEVDRVFFEFLGNICSNRGCFFTTPRVWILTDKFPHPLPRCSP